MKLKLKNDIDLLAGKKSLEIIKLNTSIFDGWNKKEIGVLSEYMRFLSYQKSTQLATKGEEVDYFGIIISGRALVQVDSKVYGYLETGDMIGYMGMVKMPGAQEQQFDIVGEMDGVIATIRPEDLKILLKKDQVVGYKLVEIMNKKNYEVVLQQYQKQKPQKGIQLVQSSIPSKRINDMFDSNPEFEYLNNVLEKRDKRYLLQSSQIIEFNSEELLIRQNQKAFIIILVKGELISFGKCRETTTYKAGDILGRKQFLEGQNFDENIYGRFNGIFIKLTRDMLIDISIQNAQSACNLLSCLIRCDCLNLKRNYEKEHEQFNEFKKKYQSQEEEQRELEEIRQKLKLTEHEKQIEENEKKLEKIKKRQGKDSEENELNDQQKKELEEQKKQQQKKKKKRPDEIDDIFVEIDILKNIQLELQKKPESEVLNEYKEFKREFEIAPLYVHEIFEDQINKQEGDQVKKKKKNDGISTFYKEKISAQQLENQAFKNELKMLRKKKQITEEEYQARLKGRTQNEYEEEEDQYEELKNDFTILQREQQEMKELIEELQKENTELRLTISQQKSEKQMLISKVNKTEFQKELLSKNVKDNQEQGVSFLNLQKKALKTRDRFNDVLDEQLQLNQNMRLVAKCAKKWIRTTRESKQRKKLDLLASQTLGRSTNFSTGNYSGMFNQTR